MTTDNSTAVEGRGSEPSLGPGLPSYVLIPIAATELLIQLVCLFGKELQRTLLVHLLTFTCYGNSWDV